MEKLEHFKANNVIKNKLSHLQLLTNIYNPPLEEKAHHSQLRLLTGTH